MKLTALPDNSTCKLEPEKYSCELVVRPDSISYLAASIASNVKNNRQLLSELLNELKMIDNWENEREVIKEYEKFINAISKIIISCEKTQIPLILQPVWKTKGKSPRLEDNCLDTFVWSNLALIHLFVDFSSNTRIDRIGRRERTLIWLCRMLLDYAKQGQFDAEAIIDKYSFNTKNDKAFAVNGLVTLPFLSSDEQKCPRIKKEEVKKIILGGGQNLLSPERRFDAIIYNSSDLFDEDC